MFFLNDGVDMLCLTEKVLKGKCTKNVLKENQNSPAFEFVFFKLLNDVISS